MISRNDVFLYNRQRLMRKKLFGNVRKILPVFFSVLALLLFLGVVYRVGERLKLFITDADYPHPELVIASAKKQSGNQPYVTPQQISALQAIPNVKSIQTRFSVISSIFPVMDRINYLPPKILIGYEAPIFELYAQVPPEKRLKNALPVLMGKDIFTLRYDPAKKVFEKTGPGELEAFIGKVITIRIDPACGSGTADYVEWNWEKNAAVLLNPAAAARAVEAMRADAIKKMEATSPHLLRYCNPLTLQLQIVGYIRDSEFFGEGYMVIPQSRAAEINGIYQEKRSAFYGEAPGHREVSRVFLLPEKGRQQEVISAVKKTGLVAATKETLNREWNTFLKTNEGFQNLLNFGYFVICLYGALQMFVFYQQFSGIVKESVREIGILRCLGATRLDVGKIFFLLNILEMLKVYLLAAVTANALLFAAGWYTADLLNAAPLDLMGNQGFVRTVMAFKGDHITSYWLLLPLWVQAFLLLNLLLLSALAAILPVLRASKVAPVQAMKE